MKSLFSRFRATKEKEPITDDNQPGSSRLNSTSSRQSTRHASSPISPNLPLPLSEHSRPSSPSGLSPNPRQPTIPTRTSSQHSSPSLRPSSALGPGDYFYGSDVTAEIRNRTLSENHAEGPGKKVTFRSPVPTPISSALLDVIQPPRPSPSPPVAGPSSPPDPRPRPRISSRQSLPQTTRKNSMPPLTSIRPSRPTSASFRSVSPSKTMSPPGTPSELQSLAPSTQSYLAQPNSWSEMAEEELIANLGPRERNRQEVLWEIVSSEERYVQELIKLSDTFCRALLPPSASSPTLTLHDPLIALSRTLSPSSTMSPSSPEQGSDSPVLPIAAQYTRSSSSASHAQKPSDESTNTECSGQSGAAARQDAYNRLTNGRPGVSGLSGPKAKNSLASMRDKARAHQSLPPTRPASVRSPSGIPESRSKSGSSSKWSGSFARLSHPTSRSGAHGSRVNSGSSLASVTEGMMREPLVLPEELEKVLKVLSGGILEGHLKLAAALRRRYEDQYPLVRSLADVFTAHSYILREYATYILHLEAALSTIDASLALALRPPPRRHSRQTGPSSAALALSRTLLALEETAAERGESGLSISLSKPFQRLLKYPLLFQNLLFNTDPSLREYEATLAMVDEVEMIVRGIEDEKVGKEERERTRDVWARIEGLEADKVLMAPKPDRLLISESQLPADEVPAIDLETHRKSRHRLSDILKRPEQADIWVIRFSDVSLLCKKTGSTQLPISSTKSKRESMPEMGSRGKYATVGKRSQSVRARNLYRFIKVHEWHLKPKTGSTEGLLSMDDISRIRSTPASTPHGSTSSKRVSSSPAPATPPKQSRSPTKTPVSASSQQTPTAPPSRTPTRVPVKTEDGPSPSRTARTARSSTDTDTMVSDRLSVMSFAFNGGDQVRPTRLRPKAMIDPNTTKAATPSSRVSTATTTTSANPARNSMANRATGGHLQGKAADAKFAHRLRSTEIGDGDPTIRTNSAARRSLPPAMMRSTVSGVSSNTGVNGRNGPVPLSPKTAVNGASTKVVPVNSVAKKLGEGLDKPVERAGSVSSRRTQPRGKVATGFTGTVMKGGSGNVGRGGMI